MLMAGAWLGALAVGVSLGLLGSGGSIVTVPVLVYLVGEAEKVAIAESLGIVAAISLVGAVPFALQRRIHWRSVLYFGLPGMAGTYMGAWVSVLVPGSVQLALFAAVMLVAAWFLLRPAPEPGVGDLGLRSAWKIAIEGLAVGLLTGLVGVGGGFLIVPALVLLGGLPIHVAVGTSLLIIALKSLSGFYKYLDVLAAADLAVHWETVGLFAVLGVLGSFVGGRIGRHVSAVALQRGFAAVLVVMGTVILWRNLGPLIR